MMQSWTDTVGADGLTFGERLRDLIDKSGKTAAEIARETGITPSTISEFQKDPEMRRNKKARVPDSNTFKMLANYFDVSYEYLFGEVRARKKKNLAASQFYGFSDKTAALLQSMQQIDGNGSDEYTKRMIQVFNNLFAHGFGDLLLDAVMLDGEMDMLAADRAPDDEKAINEFVGNSHKDRPKGTAIVSQKTYCELRISELERRFGWLLRRSLKNFPKEDLENFEEILPSSEDYVLKRKTVTKPTPPPENRREQHTSTHDTRRKEKP